LLFTICVDAHKLELIMAQRGWKMVTNDLSLLVLGIQDAALVAENMVIAAESLGLGSCFLGAAPYTPGPNTSAAKSGSGRPRRRESSASSPGGGITSRVMGTESEPG